MELKKQLRPQPFTVSGVPYNVTPFSAMDSIVILGDMLGIISPMLASLAPAMLAERGKGNKTKAAMQNITVDDISAGLVKLNGETLSKVMKELLIEFGNVTFHDLDDPNRANYEILTLDAFNELFCLNLGAALELCSHVIKMNFGSFFGTAVSLFGKATAPAKASTESTTTGNLTVAHTAAT